MTISAMTLSNQWRTRPAEDCFWTVSDLLKSARAEKTASVERDYHARGLTLVTDGGESDGLFVRGDGWTAPLGVSHHAFSQLAGLAKAPAGYLRSLPAELAADCVSVGLARRDRDERAVSLMANRETLTIRALTGENYSRLWSADLLEMVVGAMDASPSRYVTPPAWVGFGGVDDGSWSGPTRKATQADVGEWTRVKVGDTIRPAGLYYSPHDGRDTFAFFLNTERAIDLPRGGTGFRFLMLWNSESGAASVGAASGIVDVVCGNHILWGMRDVKEFRFRHVGDGLSARSHRELKSAFGVLDAAPWESKILKGSAEHILGATVADVDAAAVRATRLPLATIQAARAAVSARDYGHTGSAYAVASALTEYAQTLPRVEERVDLDRAAAKLYSITAE